MTTERDARAVSPSPGSAPGSPANSIPPDGEPTAAYQPPEGTADVDWNVAGGSDATLAQAPPAPAPQVRVAPAGTDADTRVDQTVARDDLAPEGRRTRRRRKEREEKKGSFWRELPVLIVLGIVLVVLLKAFLLQAFFIPSGSMENTLEINDRVLVNRQSYLFGDPQRGDVIVFRNWDDVGEDVPSPSIWEYITQSVREGIGLGRGSGSDDLIKRVVAVPGDTIEVRDSRVFINGEELIEPYLLVDGPDPLADFGPATVPDGKYFVMGDHRNNSADSRQDGGRFVDADAIVGKAFVRIWPMGRVGGLGAPEPLSQDQG